MQMMQKQIFVNLIVADVNKSMDFYTEIGFTNNPQFSDDTAKCMVWSEHIFVMLLEPVKFSSFTDKPLANTKENIACLLSLPLADIEAMHQIMEKGLKAGGTEPQPMKDYGFMQQRTLEDLDGNTWEFFFMDTSKIPNS